MTRRGFVAPFVLLIVILVVAFGAYYLGQLGSRRNLSIQPVSSTQPFAASPTSEPAVGPREYKSPVLKYSVKIPSGWQVIEGGYTKTPGDVLFNPPGQENGPMVSGISIRSSDKVTSAQMNTQVEFDRWLAKPVIASSTTDRIYKVANLSIDGILAVQYVSQILPGVPAEPSFNRITWFRRGDSNYYISFGPDKAIVAKYVDDYDKVINSFKFER